MGGAAHPEHRPGRLPGPLRADPGGLHRGRGDPGLRRDRVRRRLLEDRPQALARPVGPLEAAPAGAGRRVPGLDGPRPRPLDEGLRAAAVPRRPRAPGTSWSTWCWPARPTPSTHRRPRRPGRGHDHDRDPGLHRDDHDRLPGACDASDIIRGDQRQCAGGRRAPPPHALPVRRASCRRAARPGGLLRRAARGLRRVPLVQQLPGQVFMGDVGSLGLGGALAALAILTKTELLLLADRRRLRHRGALGDHPVVSFARRDASS